MESGPSFRIGERKDNNAFMGFSFVSNTGSPINAATEFGECFFHGICLVIGGKTGGCFEVCLEDDQSDDC
jgi:hypothetical protein